MPIDLVSNNLAATYSSRHSHATLKSDPDKATSAGQEVIKATPLDHLDRARQLLAYATALEGFCEAHNVDRQKIIPTIEYCQPLGRTEAGMLLGRKLLKCQEWKNASDCYRRTISIVAKLAPSYLPRQDQEFFLGKIAGLPSTVASTIFQAREESLTASSLQALESGRGVIASLPFRSKDDLTDSKLEHPKIWERYALSLQFIVWRQPDSQQASSRREIYCLTQKT
ncbi:hypothetical protein MMC08_005521 [Hypocenomyce scalaris]|nr:hypothetical protein [Hypocenomyce scalaris]